jgi:uncharacterized cupredoxin-like copper-binding protein
MKTSVIAVIAIVIVGAAIGAVFLLGGSPAPQATPGTELPYIGNEVSVRLVANELTSGKYAFNGTTDGNMLIVIPEGMDLIITVINEGQLVHDAHVYNSLLTSPLPVTLSADNTVGGAPAADPGNTDTGTAKTSGLAAGKYSLVCLQTGHASNGMWVTLEISSTAATPYVQT